MSLMMLNHAVRVNSLTELVLTKLDILSGIKTLPVCVAYELDGDPIEAYPADTKALARSRPIYETLSGWNADIMDVRVFGDLPANARRYVEFVEESIGGKVSTRVR